MVLGFTGVESERNQLWHYGDCVTPVYGKGGAIFPSGCKEIQEPRLLRPVISCEFARGPGRGDVSEFDSGGLQDLGVTLRVTASF